MGQTAPKTEGNPDCPQLPAAPGPPASGPGRARAGQPVCAGLVHARSPASGRSGCALHKHTTTSRAVALTLHTAQYYKKIVFSYFCWDTMDCQDECFFPFSTVIFQPMEIEGVEDGVLFSVYRKGRLSSDPPLYVVEPLIPCLYGTSRGPRLEREQRSYLGGL